MKYVVYEIWTRAREIDADSVDEAYEVGSPTDDIVPPITLSNWHVVPLKEETKEEAV